MFHVKHGFGFSTGSSPLLTLPRVPATRQPERQRCPSRHLGRLERFVCKGSLKGLSFEEGGRVSE